MTNKPQSDHISDPKPERQTETASEELSPAQLDSVNGAVIAPPSNALFVPDTGDEVQVAFSASSVRSPYIVGGLWDGNSKPPETSGK